MNGSKRNKRTIIGGIVVVLTSACLVCACAGNEQSEQIPTSVPTLTSTLVPTTEPTATSAPTPTLEPTAVPTMEPTSVPTEVPTNTPTPEPTAEPATEPAATAAPTMEPISTPTSTPTPEPTATSTPVPTATSTPVPTATLKPTATSTPTPTATPKPTATSTPTPTVTPKPTPTTGAASTPRPTRRPSPTPTQAPLEVLVETPVTYNGTITLDCGVEIPLLSEFNTLGLTDIGNPREHWFGYTETAEQYYDEYTGKYYSVLSATGINGGNMRFLNNNSGYDSGVNFETSFNESFDYNKRPIVLWRLPESQCYYLEFTTNLAIRFQDETSAIHDVLRLLCSSVSSTPFELETFIYNNAFADCSIERDTWYEVGDAQICYTSDAGWNFYIKPQKSLQMTPTPTPTPRPQLPAATFTGTATLECGVEIPTLSEFNWQGLYSEDTRNYGWYGDGQDNRDNSKKLGQAMTELEKALGLYYDDGTKKGTGFYVANFAAEFYWDSVGPTPDLALYRDVDNQCYYLAINYDLTYGGQLGTTDKFGNVYGDGQDDRDVLCLLLSLCSSKPMELEDWIYNDCFVTDNPIPEDTWKMIGESNVCFPSYDESIPYGQWIYVIKENK